MPTIIRTRWNPGVAPGISAVRLNNIEQAVSLTNAYEGAKVEYDWQDGLPMQALHKDSNDNVVKQIDYTWVDGLPTQEKFTLNDYVGGSLVATTEFTISYTWQDGLPTEVNIS